MLLKRRGTTVLVLLCAVVLVSWPAAHAAAAAADRAAAADPLADLGASSPTCKQDVGPAARRNCAVTGSVEHRYPVSSYGYDVQVGFSVTHPQRSFLGALQSVGALVWMALIFAMKGVLLLLEWAFSIDLLGAAMGSARATMRELHDRVIGEPWFLSALAFTALWGIWRGLVQRQTSATISGLAATIGLMTCGLVVLARPDDTVGYASRIANQASLGLLSAATTAGVDHPERSLAQATAGIFDSTVRDPWCALQFGSVDYCSQPAKGSPAKTNADVWLTYPAQSRQRTGLYRLLKGQDPDGKSNGLLGTLTDPGLDAVGLGADSSSHLPDEAKRSVAKAPQRALMQEAGGTFPRFALLGLIAIGLGGAIALLAYFGIRLLLASVLVLLLLLFTPAVLLAPAFGASGRATFVAWAKRLLSALTAKLVYALFLAVVLSGAGTLRRLDIGWFGTWLLQIAFWWGVLLKRRELIGFVSVRSPHLQDKGSVGAALGRGYYALQLGRVATRAANRAVAGPVRSSAMAFGNRRQVTRDARATAVAGLADERLDADSRRALERQQDQASATVGDRRQIDRELRAADRRLAGFDEAHVAARAENRDSPPPTPEQARLLQRRKDLLSQRDDPALSAADQVVQHAHRNRAQTGAPVTPRDLAAYRRQRAADLRAELPLDHERSLSAAGVDPAAYATAAGTDRAALLDRVRTHVDRERALMAAATEAGPAADPSPALVHIDPVAFRARVAQEREQARRERRERRTRSQPVRRR